MNTQRLTFLVLLGGIALAPAVCVGGESDRCDAILQQDLFNRVSNSTNSSGSERAAFEEHLFKLSETEAFDKYKKAFENSKAQATSGAGEFRYGFTSGALEFSHSYDRTLSQEEFAKKFNKAKEQYQKNVSNASARDTSMISLYQSSVRDSASVKAWENCMTSNRAGPGLIAYGYRDPRGSPYIVVIWAPGSYAASIPVIDVKFGVTETGMSIEGASGKVQIATGSGAAFPIRFTDPRDRRAQADGFVVLVNGELRSGNNPQSFRAEATVPRNLGAIPCAMVFGANRSYQIGFAHPQTRETQWVNEFSTSGKLPSNQLDVEEIYRIEDRKGRTFLRLRGDQLAFILRVPRGPDSPEWRDVTQMTGSCSGQGVSARFADSRIPAAFGVSDIMRVEFFILSK